MASLAAHLWERFQAAPEAVVAMHVREGGDEAVTAAALTGMAQAVRARIGAADRRLVGILLPSGPMLHAAWLGCLWSGNLPSMVAPPSPRMEPRKYAEGLAAMTRHLGVDAIVTDRATLGLLGDLAPEVPVVMVEGLEPADGPPPAEWGADEDCVVQHSSGTTGAQKAIGFTSAQIVCHADALARRLEIGPTDRIVSWLPLYHDMGFIACFVSPLVLGVPIVEMSPFDWVTRPAMLFDAIERHRATLTWLPNFAFNVLSEERLLAGKTGRWDLSSMRAFISCSEPVQASSRTRFVERLAPHGVRDDQVIASYAMAENLFLVTQNPVGHPVVRTFDRDALERGQAVPDPEGVALVSNGPVADSTQLAVRGPDGPVPEGQIGELTIAGAHVFTGYCNRPDLTAEAFDGDWFATGDLGFVLDGEVYVTGRSKDLIIIRGRNYHPHDIEALVGSVDGVNPGRIAVFGISDERTGTEKLVILAELRDGHEGRTGDISLSVRRLIAQSLDTTVGDFRAVPSRSLVKSTSGKVARAENRARYLEGAWG